MGLAVMTKEWVNLIRSIVLFLIEKRRENDAEVQELARDPVQLFNWWSQARAKEIADPDMVFWCVKHLHDMAVWPLPKLVRSAQLDGWI